jgi:hypothetical protein
VFAPNDSVIASGACPVVCLGERMFYSIFGIGSSIADLIYKTGLSKLGNV